MKRNDMIEVMDTVTFKKNGSLFRGFIKDLRKDGMSVKVIEKDFTKSLWGDFKSFMIEINEDMFNDLNLEIWSDGRGCDNSAIGVSGCHEPWDRVWILSTEVTA